VAEPSEASRLRELARHFIVPGLQYATLEGDTVRTFELGHRRLRPQEPVGAGTPFPLGSVTKVLIATVVLQLVEEGDLELDAPLASYLTGLGRLGETTVRGLLSHTSGLPDLPAHQLGPREPLVRHVHADPDVAFVCSPGTFSYSNFGYVVLCHLIEVVLGLGWREAARSFVLTPLGFPAGSSAPATAEHAVHLPTATVAVVEPELPACVVAAGTVGLPARDVLRLATVHCRPTSVLAPETAALIRKPVAGAEPFGLAAGWGLGLAAFGDGWFGHDGNTGGATCTLRVHPQRGRALVLMTNATSGRHLAEQFLAELGIGSYRGPVPVGALGGASLRALAEQVCGSYRSGDREVEVALAGDGELRFGGSRMVLYRDLLFRLAAPGDDEAAAGESRDVHRFLRSPVTGRVEALQFGGARVMSRKV
jgi:CubicO group peptidase (beta-lactamase class C family)